MIKHFNTIFTNFNNSGYDFAQKVSNINPYTNVFIHPGKGDYSGGLYAGGFWFLNLDVSSWDLVTGDLLQCKNY